MSGMKLPVVRKKDFLYASLIAAPWILSIPLMQAGDQTWFAGPTGFTVGILLIWAMSRASP